MEEEQEAEYHQTRFEHVSTIMQPTTPVKWTPEDAANFIASAIREAQRPTMEAMRRRGFSKLFYFCTCLFFIVLLGGAGYYIYLLTMRLDAEQKRQASALDARYDDAVKAAGQKLETAGEQFSARAAAATAALEQSAKTAQTLVDTSAAREQLNAVRRENGAQQFTIENQKKQIEDLKARLAEEKTARAAAEGQAKELTADINARKDAMANVDQAKAAAAAEIAKLKNAVALRETAIAQQREEIAILRKRLDTASAMSLNESAAPAETPAPANDKE